MRLFEIAVVEKTSAIELARKLLIYTIAII